MPQGSILGPLLFLVFINDLCDSVELCGTSMYADDTAIFYLSEDIDELRLSLQYDLQSIAYWMKENRLSLNASKTKFMMVGSRYKLARTREFTLSLNGDQIENVSTFKYLGILLDRNLQFHTHIDSIVDKTTSKLGLLYKTCWLFNEETALMLFKSLITPHFDYGSVLYEVAPQYQLNRLQVVQNAAARLILLADARCPIYELHEKLGLDTLATRRSKSMVKLVYACLYDQEPLYLCDQLRPVGHGHRVTRAVNKGVLEVPRVKNIYGSYMFSYRGPLQWNVTKTTLKAAVNKIQLKRLLQTSWYNEN